MASDVDRIAEVIAGTKAMRALRLEVPGHIVDDVTLNVAYHLAASDFGHVPTVLHQAADEVDTAANNANHETGPGLDEAETIVRARADRAGWVA